MINILRSLSMLYFNAESICRDPRKMHASVRHRSMHKTVSEYHLPWISSDHLILRHTSKCLPKSCPVGCLFFTRLTDVLGDAGPCPQICH